MSKTSWQSSRASSFWYFNLLWRARASDLYTTLVCTRESWITNFGSYKFCLFSGSLTRSGALELTGYSIESSLGIQTSVDYLTLNPVAFKPERTGFGIVRMHLAGVLKVSGNFRESSQENDPEFLPTEMCPHEAKEWRSESRFDDICLVHRADSSD